MTNYYDEHAKEFINSTINCNMEDIYSFFNKYLNGCTNLLDIGFGSARDMLYFKNKGIEVYGIDTSSEMCKNAKKLGLKNVYNLSILDFKTDIRFDAIWACASLLHVESSKLNEVLINCCNLLRDNKYMYVSFKYGTFEGVRNNRYYIDMTLEKFLPYLNNTNLKVVDTLISTDVRSNNDTKWLNIILQKVK